MDATQQRCVHMPNATVMPHDKCAQGNRVHKSGWPPTATPHVNRTMSQSFALRPVGVPMFRIAPSPRLVRWLDGGVRLGDLVVSLSDHLIIIMSLSGPHLLCHQTMYCMSVHMWSVSSSYRICLRCRSGFRQPFLPAWLLLVQSLHETDDMGL
jgi:hypothetical protein